MRKQEHIEGGVTGWTARLTDGSVAREADGVLWGDIKSSVAGLELQGNNVAIELPRDQLGYTQSHSGTCSLAGGDVKIEGRMVGFITPSGDRVDIWLWDGSGKIRVEVQECRRP